MKSERTVAGPVLVVGVTLALTWATSAIVMGAWSTDDAPTTRLLRASVLYAVVVGWQPLVAMWIVRRFVDRSFVDHSRRRISRHYTWFSIALPLLLLSSAALVDLLVGTSRTEPTSRHFIAGGGDVVVAFAAFVGVFAVLWLQAVVEELAWRGYVLPRLMEALGPWPGLFAHGLLWGACYAPVLVGGGDLEDQRLAAGFIVTCGLLGVLLGWLRLASGSIVASAACNATLTICAGLPLVLQGASPLLGAVFEPAGWLPMLVLVLLIAVRAPWRAAVAVPRRRVPEHLN